MLRKKQLAVSSDDYFAPMLAAIRDVSQFAVFGTMPHGKRNPTSSNNSLTSVSYRDFSYITPTEFFAIFGLQIIIGNSFGRQVTSLTKCDLTVAKRLQN
jgi:hypothetical protein